MALHQSYVGHCSVMGSTQLMWFIDFYWTWRCMTVQNSLLLFPILRQIQSIPSCSTFVWHVILSCHLHPSLEGSLLFRFSDSNFVFIADSIILYLFTKVISEWYKFLSCSLYTCTFILTHSLPKSTLVHLIFQSRSFSLGRKLVQQLQYI
jgi:hypothetical protein